MKKLFLNRYFLGALVLTILGGPYLYAYNVNRKERDAWLDFQLNSYRNTVTADAVFDFDGYDRVCFVRSYLFLNSRFPFMETTWSSLLEYIMIGIASDNVSYSMHFFDENTLVSSILISDFGHYSYGVDTDTGCMQAETRVANYPRLFEYGQ